MKISILGCGNQGSGMAGILSKEKEIDQLVLADYDIERANKTLEQIKSLGSEVYVKDIKVDRVDGTDTADIVKTCEGSDIIFNATFPACNLPIMEACLETESHYLDLYSHPFEMEGIPYSETVGAQFDLSEKFKAKGLSGFPCLGINPGWEYLVSMYAMSRMDVVESVKSRDFDWTDSDELVMSVAPFIFFELFFGSPNMSFIEESTIKEIELVKSEEVYTFPDPIGKRSLYGVVSPQFTYLVDKFSKKPIKFLAEKFGVSTGGLEMKDLWIKSFSNITSGNQAINRGNIFELLGSSINGDLEFKDAFDSGIIRDGAPVASVEVIGTREGKKVRHTVDLVTTLKESNRHWPYGGHSVYTTVGGFTVVLLLMLANNELTTRGVLTPDGITDYETLFKRVEARGHQILERVENID